MTQLTALYFPETDVSTETVTQELLLFEKIFFYQAVEGDETASSATGENLCSGYPPVPFGKDLDRFKTLLRDLKGHEDEFYGGQLSSMHSSENRGEKTVTGLITSITGTKESTENEKKAYEALWQSRLLLKLAEIMTKEEQELQDELTALSRKEELLFDTLKGDQELAKTLTPPTSHPKTPPVRPEIILKAWGHLFLADTQETPWVLTTADPEYGEILFETSESLSQQRPLRLCRIPLPDTTGMDSDTYITNRNNFRKEGKETLEVFGNLLEKTAQQGQQDNTIKDWAGMAADLTRLLATSDTWDQSSMRPPTSPQPHLELYLCSHPLHTLIAHFCRFKGEINSKNQPAHAIIAVKSSKKIQCG
ncbi:MAG: hypothetical protein H8E41_01675 [Desulfobulbaceae bacterium]|uniref:Uncharacterized protein n=1 Tax=Candidatus Desulfobia pelagia TaxID=2841692 RepID=A0A8J6NC45_9BACT|nr:hypothetical protein [Candidatus Desulfobia pelagia]